MATDNLILAVSSDGKEITVKKCNEYLADKDKENLANFIYDRLYGRYLKPFSYPSNIYTKNYKNGFSIMASCCLLIETYVSFINKKYTDTKNQSGKCFGYFFTTDPRFRELSTGGLKKDGTLADKKDGGTPNDFYENVRCGILHNAETKNGWTITRNEKKPYFNPSTKEINATKFSNRLKAVLSDYRKELMKADFDKDEIWDNFRQRLHQLIIKS